MDSGVQFNDGFWNDVPPDVLELIVNQLGGENETTNLGLDQLGMGTGLGGQEAMLQMETFDSQGYPSELSLDSFGGDEYLPTPLGPMSPGSLGGSFMTFGGSGSQVGAPTSLLPPPEFVKLAEEQAERTRQIQDIVSQIGAAESQQAYQIEQQFQTQHQVIMSGNRQAMSMLHEQLVGANQQIEKELTQLNKLNQSAVLEAPQLSSARILGHRLQFQQQKLEVRRKELELIQEGSSGGVCALVLSEQPIPQAVFKGKLIEEPFTVHLLTGAITDVERLSVVKAALVSEEKTWKSNKPLENDEAEMDMLSKSASFHKLKICVPTRMNMVHLKMGVQVQRNNGELSIVEGHPSFPLIVITNESQWCDAEGTLLLSDTFGGQADVPWPAFANTLHYHFLHLTRQEKTRPQRSLSAYEFYLIHRKFFNSQPVVTQQQVKRFWNWFGHVVQTLRFKRHINSLWFGGLIYGLINKDLCNRYLSGQDVGTFLIRFSESHPGLFAVAYRSDEPGDLVKHYLVKPDDTGSQKTLPDFLREKPQFKFSLQLDTTTGQLRRQRKDDVLSPFYSKGRRIQAQQNGYVLL